MIKDCHYSLLASYRQTGKMHLQHLSTLSRFQPYGRPTITVTANNYD